MKESLPKRKLSAGNIVTVVLAVLLAAAVGVIIFLLAGKSGSDRPPEPPASGQTAEVSKNTDTIDIPGYVVLNFIPDSEQQYVCLSNPPQNTCFFNILLFLEDGTQIWESGLTAPGEDTKAIRLTQPLKEGTYENARLKFECFSMDGTLKPFNGAENKLTLKVYPEGKPE